MKHKLKIEELSVESFTVAPESTGERGTVRGHARPTQAETICQFTCRVDDCIPTFVYSCPNDPELCGQIM